MFALLRFALQYCYGVCLKYLLVVDGTNSVRSMLLSYSSGARGKLDTLTVYPELELVIMHG